MSFYCTTCKPIVTERELCHPSERKKCDGCGDEVPFCAHCDELLKNDEKERIEKMTHFKYKQSDVIPFNNINITMAPQCCYKSDCKCADKKQMANLIEKIEEMSKNIKDLVHITRLTRT